MCNDDDEIKNFCKSIKLKICKNKHNQTNLQLLENDKSTFSKMSNRYFEKNQNTPIPKIIHQIWLGPHKPPFSMDSWKNKYCSRFPDWKYKLWTEYEIRRQLDLINLSYYQKDPRWDAKSDIARYEILYRFGGMYIDSDCHWTGTRTLDDVYSQCD